MKCCSSMVRVATFGTVDAGSNPDSLAVWNSNQNWLFTNNTSVWYLSKHCNPVMGGILVVGDK